MQVDTAIAPPPGPMSDLGTDPGQLTRYLGAIRRRWPILVACVVLGALVGAVTTQQADAVRTVTTKNYYKATHTLISDSVFVPTNEAAGTSNGGSGGMNLSQDAFLVTTGEVPVRTANKLGVPPEVILSSVSAAPRADVSSLEITAFAASPDEAVKLADTSASELMAYLGETASSRYNKQRDDVLARLDELKRQRTVLEQQLAVTPVDQRPAATPELDSVVNQYRVSYEQFQQLAAQGQPSAGLRTIQASTPIEITQDQFTSERESIILGPNANGPTTTTAADAKKATPSTPAPPASAPVRAGAGGFLGLLVGISLVLLLDRFDTRLRRRETVEAATGLAVLSEIPPLDRKEQHETHVLAAAEPRSSTAEAYRVVRTAMVFARSDFAKSPKGALSRKRGEVVMVTSPNPSEGKTTSVANLAAVFAEGGQSVLVIDCDFRRPRIHRYLAEGFNLDAAPQEDAKSMTITAANGRLKAMPTDIEGVRLVTGMGDAFPDANPIEIVQYQREVIAFAREHFDIVMLDTAPFLTTNDASELLEETDVVFLVVRSGKTPYAAANRASEFLRRLDAPVLGVILTASADATAAQYYYHYYLGTEGSRRRPAADVGSNGNGNGDKRREKVTVPEPLEASQSQEP